MLYQQVALKTPAIRAAEALGHAPRRLPGNHAWIDFRGGPGTFPTYSLADVVAGRVPPRAFTGKTVFIGVTAPVQKDIFVTAASALPISGVEIHANALQTALDGFPLAPVPPAVDVALLLALVALPVLLALRLPSLVVMAGSVVLLALFLLGAQLAFDAGHIVAVVGPVLALSISCAGIVAADAYVERRQRRALEELGFLRPAAYAFSSPTVARTPSSSRRRCATNWHGATALRACSWTRAGSTRATSGLAASRKRCSAAARCSC